MLKIFLFYSLTLLLVPHALAADLAPPGDDNEVYTQIKDADTLPLWEVGIGAGGLIGPAYPASGETTTFGLALPYFVYRGDIIRFGDGEIAKIIALENERLEIGFSFDGSIPADSDDVDIRQGMPDLDYLFEIGPQLRYKVLETDFQDQGQGQLNMALQARAVFSTDFSNVNSRGYVLEPNISYKHQGFFGEDTKITASIGAMFGTERLQDYFYEVDPQYARAGRPAFDADGGYIGTDINLSISKNITDRVRGFVGANANFHQGAENDSSPLFQEDVTFGIGAGFVWSLYQSEARVVAKR